MRALISRWNQVYQPAVVCQVWHREQLRTETRQVIAQFFDILLSYFISCCGPGMCHQEPA
jgi:hypothetical protein